MVGVLQRQAWVIVAVLGVLETTFGLTLLALGAAAVPNVITELGAPAMGGPASSSSAAALSDYLARGWGQANIQYGILALTVALFPFRRRERWSWYVLWLIPVTLLVTVARNVALGVMSVVIIDLAEALVAAVVLVLVYPLIFRDVRSASGGRK